MKTGIHPAYHLTAVQCSCGNRFETRSAAATDDIHVEVCAVCHPFYTGRQKIMDSGGRIEKFQQRLEKAEKAQRVRG